MRYGTARLATAIQLQENDSGGPVTSRIKVLGWGETDLRDSAIRVALGEPGTLIVDERSAEMIPAAFARRQNEYHINVNHEHWGPAYGWITGVDVVAGDGLFFVIEWNDEGVECIRGKRYIYFSGEMPYEVADGADVNDDMIPDTGRIIAVTGGALTNRPAVGGLQPLQLSQLPIELGLGGSMRTGGNPREDTEMSGDRKWWEPLTRFFKGSNVVDETGATLAVAELAQKADRADELTAELATVRDSNAELTAKLAEREQLVTELTANLEAEKAKVAELAKLAKTDQQRAAEVAVDAEINGPNRRLTPAQRDTAIKLYLKDQELYNELIECSAQVGPSAGTDVDAGAVPPPADGDERTAQAARVKAHMVKLSERGREVSFAEAAEDLERSQKAGGV